MLVFLGVERRDGGFVSRFLEIYLFWNIGFLISWLGERVGLPVLIASC